MRNKFGRAVMFGTMCKIAVVTMASAGASLAVGEAADPPWATIIESLGVPVALVYFFLYQNWRHETRTEKVFDEDRQYIRGVLTQELVETRKAVLASTVTQEKVAAVLERHNSALESKPCLFSEEVRQAAREGIIAKYSKDK